MGGMFLLGSFSIAPYEARLLHLIFDPFSKSVPRGQHSRFTGILQFKFTERKRQHQIELELADFYSPILKIPEFADDPFTFVMKPISQNISLPYSVSPPQNHSSLSFKAKPAKPWVGRLCSCGE